MEKWSFFFLQPPPKKWRFITYNPLKMKEQVVSQGIWWYLICKKIHHNVSRSKSSWPSPTFPEIFSSRIFTKQSTEVSKISVPNRSPSELTHQVFFQCEISFSFVYHFRYLLNFSSNNSQEQRGFILQRGLLDSVSYNLSPKFRLIEVANWLISCESPCDLGFLAIVCLHYGWIEVEGEWVCENGKRMIKKTYLSRCKMVLSTYTDPKQNFSRGENLKPWLKKPGILRWFSVWNKFGGAV